MSLYQQQREIKKGIEQDIQRELQQMLGLLLGRDKVVVSVMASVDFTKEKREEELVEPVDLENNQGIEISVEKLLSRFQVKEARLTQLPALGKVKSPIIQEKVKVEVVHQKEPKSG